MFLEVYQVDLSAHWWLDLGMLSSYEHHSLILPSVLFFFRVASIVVDDSHPPCYS